MVVIGVGSGHGRRNCFPGDNIEKARDPKVLCDPLFKKRRGYGFRNDIALPSGRWYSDVDFSYIWGIDIEVDLGVGMSYGKAESDENQKGGGCY